MFFTHILAMPGRYLGTRCTIAGIYLELKRRGAREGGEEGLWAQYTLGPKSFITPTRI